MIPASSSNSSATASNAAFHSAIVVSVCMVLRFQEEGRVYVCTLIIARLDIQPKPKNWVMIIENVNWTVTIMRIMCDGPTPEFKTLIGRATWFRVVISRFVPNLINPCVIPADPNDAVESIAMSGMPSALRIPICIGPMRRSRKDLKQ